MSSRRARFPYFLLAMGGILALLHAAPSPATQRAIEIPLSPGAARLARSATHLRVSIADSLALTLGRSDDSTGWSIREDRIAITLPLAPHVAVDPLRLEARTGSHRDRGAIAGSVIAGVALLAYAAFADDDGGEFSGIGQYAAIVYALPVIAVGAGTGALIGGRIPRYELLYSGSPAATR